MIWPELLRHSYPNRASVPYFNSLARDLQCADKTVKRWLTILENMYVIFRVGPCHLNIACSILKVPKYYLSDVKRIQLVKDCSREKTYPDGTEIRQAHKWLASFSLGTDE